MPAWPRQISSSIASPLSLTVGLPDLMASSAPSSRIRRASSAVGVSPFATLAANSSAAFLSSGVRLEDDLDGSLARWAPAGDPLPNSAASRSLERSIPSAYRFPLGRRTAEGKDPTERPTRYGGEMTTATG